MTPPVKLVLILMALALALLGAAAIPWSSRTVVNISAVDEEGRPLPGARIGLISAQGGTLAEGTTDENGVLVLKYSPDPETDWGKLVWRFNFFLDGYAANETPVTISERKSGSFRGWIPGLSQGVETPHLLFLINARFICKKIT